MATRQVDVLIVGAGLAGTTLAWRLRQRNITFAIVDDRQAGASHAAAGLITPVTGKALRVEPQFASLLSSAQRFYRDIEHITGTHLLKPQTTVRYLTQPKAQRHWQQRGPLGLPYTDTLAVPPESAPASSAPCLTLRCTYRLDVRAYLDASRMVWQSMNTYLTGAPSDTQINHALEQPSGILDCNGITVAAKRIVCCRGAADRHSDWFTGLHWRCAKGDVLQVEAQNAFGLTRIHADGHWLSPTTSHQADLGATYSWDRLDNTPDADARQYLLARATALTPHPLTVTAHVAGVRPIVGGRAPVIGPIPGRDALLLCNGLGSKGSLLAPTVTHQLARFIASGEPVAPRYCLRQRLAALTQ